MAKYIDFCNNCRTICKQKEIKKGEYGCEHCGSSNNIEMIKIEDYYYEREDNDDKV